MRRVTCRLSVVLVALAAAAGIAGGSSAAQPVPYPIGPSSGLRVTAYRSDVGWINIRVVGRPGSRVEVAEQTPDGPVALFALTLVAVSSSRRHVLDLRCDRTQRTIVATATAPDGSSQTAGTVLVTPSCHGRLRLTVTPAHPRLGYRATLDVSDLWHSGDIAFSVCITAPRAAQHCRPERLPPGAARLGVRFRAARVGRWQVELVASFERVVRTVEVRGGRLVMLATGDSEIQGIDSDLADALRGPSGARVISEAHISSSISGTFFFDWPARAPEQARSDHPDVTVMYLGGNEGFALRTRGGRQAPCCGRDWTLAYADRVAGMMSAYLRGGAGRVYWFTLPAPSSAALARVLRSVNAAIIIAAARFPAGVRVTDIRPVFTPGGRFRSSMRYRGRDVVVREPDGYHLSYAGDAIATSLLLTEMRADGVLG